MDSESFEKSEEIKESRYGGIVSGIDNVTESFYSWLRNSFVGRIFDVYGRVDRAVFGSYGAIKPTSEIRRRLAGKLENRGFFGALSRFISFLISCPLRMFGVFYLSCAVMTAAMYFISLGFNTIPMFAGTIYISKNNLIVGGVLAVISIPLLFSSVPISIAITDSHIGRMMFGEGIKLPEKHREAMNVRRDNVVTVLLSVILGIGAGYCTRFMSPILIPIAVCVVPIVALVFVIPEIGAVLTVAVIPVLTVVNRDGYLLPIVITILWGAYLIKIFLGKRSFKLRLIDLFVAILCVILLASGLGSAGGDGKLIFAVRFTIILSAYFPLCNLLKNNGWGMRCIKSLGISFFIMACIGVLSGFFGEYTVEWLNNGGFYEYAERVRVINSVYSDSVLTSCMSIMAIPAVLPKLKNRKSAWNVILTVVSVAVMLLVIYFGGDVRAWRALLWSFIIMLLISSHKSATAVLLASVPATCIAINANSVLDRLVKPIWTPIKQTVAQLFNFEATSVVKFDSAIKMIADNPFGVGIGSDAFSSVYENYADGGIEKVVDAGNFLLELTAEIGVAGLLATLAIIVMFIQICVSSLKHIYSQTYSKTVIMILASIIGMMIYGTYTWIWQDIEAFSIFWCLVAIGVALIRNGIDDSLHARNEQDSTFWKSDITIE